jgi:protein O-GlcNAc transferase
MDVEKATQSAHDLHLAGRLEQAEDIYKEILSVQQDNAAVCNDLGNLLQEQGRFAEAVEYYQKATQINPDFAGAYYNLAETLHDMGRLDEASGYYEKVIKLSPDFAGAYYNLGVVMQEKRQFDEAAANYMKVLELNPNDANTCNNIGIVMEEKGLLDSAISFYRRAIELDPDFAVAYNNLGDILQQMGQQDEAILNYEKAVQLNPTLFTAYNKLGIILQEKGKLDEAVDNYQKAIQLDSAFAEAYNNLGTILQEKGQLDDAVKCYQKAVELDSTLAVAYDNLRSAFQARLMMMNYDPKYDAQQIFSEHLRFSKEYAEPLYSDTRHTNDCSSSRRIRIGYVSPDFKRHPVAYFIEPVLSAHNKEGFEIFCYSDVKVADKVTERIQTHADRWRNIRGMSDEEVAPVIREDRIDILVDLAGHTDSNRMLLFARKPSPVQVSWLGYPATTGLSAMDYKVVDNYTDPAGMTEQFYTEQLIRMPESFLCYLPDGGSPEVGRLPALSSGHITFGSFNNFVKVSTEVVKLWTSIMKTIPDSHLIMKGKSFADKTTCQSAINMFVQEGIDAERITLEPFEQSPSYLESYNLVDIGLDTFPWNGITTTCDALWMGVPVVTLAGSAYASRAGVSLLTNVGIPELVARTHDEYVSTAVSLADNLGRLQFLREHLRDMMRTSPLCDAKRFTANLETCYRQIWEKWCRSTNV